MPGWMSLILGMVLDTGCLLQALLLSDPKVKSQTSVFIQWTSAVSEYFLSYIKENILVSDVHLIYISYENVASS